MTKEYRAAYQSGGADNPADPGPWINAVGRALEGLNPVDTVHDCQLVIEDVVVLAEADSP